MMPEGGPPAEPEVFHRKHKSALRREESFKRMDSIPQRVDQWIHIDAQLHESWAAFRQANVSASPAFAAPTTNTAPESSIVEMDHAARGVHAKFCEAFEAQLEAFLAKQRISVDQFQEAFRISQEEEAEQGETFYRWQELVELEPFIVFMREGTGALLRKIDELSASARVEHRKRSTWRPLLVQWTPKKFSEVLEGLEAATRDIDLGQSKADRKEAARWQLKLSQQTLNKDGVYADPEPDEAEWARFLAFATQRCTLQAFNEVVGRLRSHVENAQAGERLGGESDVRRALLDCFSAFDRFHTGRVSLALAVESLLKCKMAPEKQIKRAATKWRLQASQHALDQKAEGTATANEDDSLSEADGDVRLNLKAFLGFVEDALRATDDADHVMLIARVKKASEVARHGL